MCICVFVYLEHVCDSNVDLYQIINSSKVSEALMLQL